MEQRISTFIPIDRYAALAVDRDLPDRVSGAVLFADISGFTPLTAALVREYGSLRGAEEMTSNMNRIYDALVEETHRFGGSVVSFCGDAIICWFDNDDLRSVACGLAMREAIRPHATILVPSGAVFTVAIKVMIAHGAARRFLPGDPAIRLIDVLAGNTITTTAIANRCAQPGEVLLDAHTAEEYLHALDLAEWRDEPRSNMRFAVLNGLSTNIEPSPWPSIDERVSDAVARRWLWPSIYERLRRSSDQLLSELRPVVALFLAFDGIDYDQDDAAGQQLDLLIRYVQHVVEKYEGFFVELTIGDKGSYLYAAFGAPTAHDDDADRAMSAGLELCHLPPELASINSVRIGIAQGQAYTGIYGGAARRTYGVQGTKVNLAARLMEQATAWTICCDAEVYRRTHDRWLFADLPTVRIKGVAEPVAVYQALGPRDTDRRRPAHQAAPQLIGRATEVERLAAVLNVLEGGGQQVLVIEGEAGIGKSLLAARLLQLAIARGFSPLQGGGQSMEQHTPYRAWRDIFRAYFALEEQPTPELRLARVTEMIEQAAPGSAVRLALLNDLLHLDAPESPLLAALDPMLRQESLMQLVGELLRARARPLVLLFEDAQWLDSLSWTLAIYVLRTFMATGEPLLMVIVTRPIDDLEPAARFTTIFNAFEITNQLALTALSPEATVALAANRLGLTTDKLPKTVAEIVYQRSGGNPFFAEELILALRDHDLIAVESSPTGNRCVITGDLAAARETLPTTLHELVLSRIDRLPPDHQLTLKVAAVIGHAFAYTPLHWTLTQYVPTANDILRAQLDDLIRRNITILESLEQDLTYLFKHIITRDVAYQTLLFSQRKQIHRHVAEWYERVFPAGALAPFYALLVHHYHHAENIERERTYARLAGQQAAAQYANPEAIGYLSRALDLTPESDSAARYELLQVREKVYDLQGARQEQRADLDALAAIADLLDDSRRRAETMLRRSVLADHLGTPAIATAAAQECIELAHATGQFDLEAAAYQWWGLILYAQGHTSARTPLERALTLARTGALTNLEAQCQAALGNIDWLEGSYDSAVASYQRALALYRAAGDRRGESTTINNLGIVVQLQGNYSSARAYYTQALRMKRELGDRRGEGKALTCLGTLLSDLGMYRAARVYYEQALPIFREIGGRAGEGEVLALLGELSGRLGTFEMAQLYGEQAAQNAQARGSRDDYARALRPIAQALAGLGAYDQAVQVYNDALSIWRELELPNMLQALLAELARIALARGDLLLAIGYVEEVIGYLASSQFEASDEFFLIYLACYQVLQAASDPRAPTLLQDAHTALEQKAAQIDDPDLRRSFRENVRVHHEIVAAWVAAQAQQEE